jgi:5,10-methylenetetrahydromethanopterin reductase
MTAVAGPSIEFWTVRLALPGTIVRAARKVEEEGWDGLALGDSQNLAGDPYVELAVAASVTSRIGLGVAVTNPVTRHPAATATAIASVQVESEGRAVLGIGRGDSALAHIGLSPAPVPVFEAYVRRLQGYLRRDEVPFDLETDGRGALRSAEALGFAGGPESSRIRWLPADLPKVPVDVMASGPRMIALGAELGDRLTLAVGSDPDRVRWAMDLAHTARREAGLEAAPPSLGLFVPVTVHPDRAIARYLASGAVGSFARFSVMHGTAVGPVDEVQREQLKAVHDAYDMNKHFTHGSGQSKAMTDDLIDRFGIAGPVSYCIDKLTELAEMGISRIIVSPGAAASGNERDELRMARQRLVDEVLPAFR